ncbi:MAG TPA: AAA family ATPase, partial [Gaiellaceae bacterium]|nr:AAA family ATPase [Gaiellaceae bacterium]
MDPEDVAAELARYQGRVRAELERYGGTVEKFIGDAAMAIFGAPTAHEDDPERAVRAALAIRDWAVEVGIEVRIGVSTGEALVTLGARPEAGETMAAGDVVNTAARLQSAAPVDGVLVGEQTFRATETAIEYERADPVAAKGKAELVPVWHPVRARARFTVERVHGAALVGRKRELELLAGSLDRAREERSPQLVTLVGVPGIGKSRLVFELFERIEREPGLTSWRRGRCLPYGDGVTFWALGEMVKAQAGILDGDDAATAEAKLRTAVEDTWVELHLRPLVGLTGGAEGGGDRRDEAFAAWRRFFEGLAEQRPLVLVFEDLHWADEDLLDFVDYLVEWAGAVPLLVVCTARPELLTRRPGWGGGKPNALTISLSPLADEEMARLLGELLDRSLLLAETQAELLTRAGGNPLYAEEYARMLRERGDVAELPETVQGMIAARLDLLEPDQKALLQDAAVVGRTFWLGALAALGSRDRVEERLHALERKEFVRRERTPSVADEVEYSFRHLLVRDVAYAQIPRAERTERHRRTAEWFESLGRREDHAEMLAHHYLQALELGAAAGIDTTPFAEAAQAALADAGGRALALNAFDAAVRYYRAALELLPEGDPRHGGLLLRLGRAFLLSTHPDAGVLEAARDELVAAGEMEAAADAETALAELYWFWGDHDVSVAHLGRARELVEGLPPSPVKAHTIGTASRFLMLAGESEEAIRLGREALAMAEQLGLDEVRAAALNNIGSARSHLGDRGARADAEAAVELAERSQSIFEFCRAKANLAAQLWVLGELATARRLWQEAGETAERFGQVSFARWHHAVQSKPELTMGDWDDALRRVTAFLAEVEAGSPHYLAGQCYMVRAMILLARGETAAALADAERSIAACRRANDPQMIYNALADSAHVLLQGGDREGAAAAAGEFLDAIRQGQSLGAAIEQTYVLAWTLTELGRGAELAAALAEFDQPWARAAAAFGSGDPA